MSEVTIPRPVQSGAQPSESIANICVALWVTPASRWESLLPLFEAAGFSTPPQTATQSWLDEVRKSAPVGRLGVAALKPMHNPALRTVSDELFASCAAPILIRTAEEGEEILADFADRELPDGRLLLLHERPERMLVEAMRAGTDPEAMLERWMQACRRLLEFYRRNRGRASLIDVDVALAAPAGFIEFCARSFGSAVPARIPRPVTAASGTEIAHLIAAQMIAQSREVKRLLAELEALSSPIGEPQDALTIDCAAVFREQLKHRESLNAIAREREAALAQLDAKKEEYQKEKELLLLQLNQLQEELEGLSSEMRRLRDSAAAQQAERERLEGRVAELSAACEEQNQRIVHLVGERERQVRELQARITQVEAERAELAALAEARNGEVIELRTRLEAADAGLREAKQDNELLLLQLHQAQEELESSYRQFQSANARQKKTEEELRQTAAALTSANRELESTTAELKSATRELRLTRERLRKSKEMLALARRKISYRERRIRYMESSRSWKVTAPLRAMVNLFSGRGSREDAA